MKLNFNDIIDKHKNMPCIVIAHGPSLNNILDKLPEYKNKGYILIDCNDYYSFHDISPTYIVYANNVETMFRNKDRLNKLDSTVLYADSVDLINKQWVENNIVVNYLPYDQRHFDGKKCIACDSYGCSKHLNTNRLTIQEELKKYSNHDKRYGTGDTVTLHMLSLSVLLGCNPIYIAGFDMDYSKGYAKSENQKSLRIPLDSEIEPYRDNVMRDAEIIRDSAKNKGVEIINLNKNSKFDILNIGEIE